MPEATPSPMTTERPATLAGMLSERMRERQLDYRTLAGLVGVSHTYLWQLARPRSPERPKRPGRPLVEKLAAVLELPLDHLLAAAGHAPEEVPSDGPPPAPVPGIVKYARFESDAPALFQKGLDETRRGNAERGIALLRAAVGQEGVSFFKAHMGLGVAYLKAGRLDSALEELDKAIAQFIQDAPPGVTRHEGVDLADLHYNRGLALQDAGRHAAAVRDFRRALALDGRHADRYVAGLAFSELALGHDHRTLAAGTEFAARTAEAPPFTTAALDVRLYQAFALARRGQFEAARSLADAVELLCPTYWYGPYVHAAVLSRYAERLHARARAGRKRAGAQLEAVVAEGLRRSRRALALNPNCRGSFRSERDGDLAYFARRPEFAEIFAPERATPEA